MENPKCKNCKRPLRDPVSIAVGYGPECRNGKSKKSRRVGLKTERARNFAHREPIVFTEKTYIPIAGQKWKERETGRVLSSENLLSWMVQYSLVDPKVIEAFKLEKSIG